jgi:hypothetical protein
LDAHSLLGVAASCGQSRGIQVGRPVGQFSCALNLMVLAMEGGLTRSVL